MRLFGVLAKRDGVFSSKRTEILDGKLNNHTLILPKNQNKVNI